MWIECSRVWSIYHIGGNLGISTVFFQWLADPNNLINKTFKKLIIGEPPGADNGMIMQMLSDGKKSMEANYAQAYSSYFERDGVDVGFNL